LSIKDIPLENGVYSSVGAQTWGGAVVLAEDIALDPHSFSLDRATRVLELGAGTGLVGLIAAKVQERLQVHSKVIATDFYPAVLHNLERNVLDNFPTSEKTSIEVVPAALDWQHPVCDPPLDEPFDVIFGADIIYEADHAAWIKACLGRLLRRPTSNSPFPAIFHLVIPLRRTHDEESQTVRQVFSPACDDTGERQLKILEERTIVCEAEQGRSAEEVEYAYFKIGWTRVDGTCCMAECDQ
jgi:SAM-dependent methyltransferase